MELCIPYSNPRHSAWRSGALSMASLQGFDFLSEIVTNARSDERVKDVV